MKHAEIIEDAAADWVARHDRGLSDVEQRAFDDWLGLDTRHRIAWLRLDAAWTRADRLNALAPASTVAAPRNGPRRGPRRAGGMHALRRASPVAQAAVGLAACAVLALGGHFSFIQIWGAPIATEVGGRVIEPLADGSRLELNTDSRVRVSVNPLRRQVWLDRGEAYFDVATDASRPFVINVGGPKVTVIGTRFSVLRVAEDVTVRVTEGAVEVRSENGETVVAKPGDEVTVAARTLTLTARGVERLQDEMGWRAGRLIFHDATLSDVAAQFNRHNSRKLRITDPEVAQVRIGGAFASSNVDGFASLLESAYDLRIRRSGDEIIVSR